MELVYVSFAAAIVYKQAVLFQNLILNYFLRIAYYFWFFFGMQSGPDKTHSPGFNLKEERLCRICDHAPKGNRLQTEQGIVFGLGLYSVRRILYFCTDLYQ